MKVSEAPPVLLENREPKLAEGCFTLEGLVLYAGLGWRNKMDFDGGESSVKNGPRGRDCSQRPGQISVVVE